MAVQHEVKSQLAKLLATEDLIVEHKQVSTAQFDIHTRILTLPLWEKASNDVYDMLVGHEVGHALYTPDDWSWEQAIPMQFINVVEDARIEKLMKRKYMGLAKTFYNGYKKLHEEDFFEVKNEDLTTFNLADRANLHFKVGHFLDLDFLPAEKEIIDMIERCETFADTKKAAFVLYQYCVEQKKKEENKKKDVVKTKVDSSSNTKEKEEEVPDYDWYDDEEDIGDVEEKDEPEVKTAESLTHNLEDLVNVEGVPNVYLELPKVKLDTVIATNNDVHEEIDASFVYQQEINSYDLYQEVDEEFLKFKKDAQKEVSYLVKEFECRKSASSYSRGTVSKTGILDTTNLHQYKFSEDLFRKIRVQPDGKNHGLLFILDWSGSMCDVMVDTLKQLYNLMWFCRKVNIPFEVYAFTMEWRRTSLDYKTGEHIPADLRPHYDKKEGVFRIDEQFNLMNLFTSKVKSKTLEHQMLNIWRLALSFSHSHYTLYTYPHRLSLSGTPLNETLVTLHQILPRFQKENKVEKVQCIVLTDGEANPLPYHTYVKRRWEGESFLGCRNIHPDRCFLRDRKVGKVYKFQRAWFEFTKLLLINLKDNFPNVNFIGIRVVVPREANQFIKIHHWHNPEKYNKVYAEWKKDKSFIIKDSGYDAYFGLSSSILSQDVEFDVDEDATKAQIKKAFVKSLRVKKLNKKVLSEFIELVV